MGNLLNSISLFIARRSEAAPQGNAARSGAVRADPSVAPSATTLPPPIGAGANLDLYHDDSAQEPERSLPLMTYPTQREDVVPSKARRSRTLNVLRTSTSIALPTRPMPQPQTGVARQHDLQLTRVLLTETERVRLQVMQVQIRLARLSLYEGPIDGTFNPETVTGVRHFQTLKGMRPTGTLAAGTLSALGVPPVG